MPYTTQGWMTGSEVAEALKDADLGSTVVMLDDPPAWYEVPERCPICCDAMEQHEAVRVTDASGEIQACLMDGGVWLQADFDQGRPW